MKNISVTWYEKHIIRIGKNNDASIYNLIYNRNVSDCAINVGVACRNTNQTINAMIYPFIWFILITTAIVIVVPKILDQFLYYFDKRSRLYADETDLMKRRNEVIKEQIKLQEIQTQRRVN